MSWWLMLLIMAVSRSSHIDDCHSFQSLCQARPFLETAFDRKPDSSLETTKIDMFEPGNWYCWISSCVKNPAFGFCGSS